MQSKHPATERTASSMAITYQNGKYVGRITEQALGKSKKKGTPEIQIRFAVLGAVDPVDPEGHLLQAPIGERTVYLYITTNTAEYVLRDLGRLGFDGDSFSKIDPQVAGWCDLTGKEVEFECRSETYDGEEREKWQVASAIHSTPLDTKQVQELDALYGRQLKAASKAVSKAAKETPAVDVTEPVPAQTEPADGIPF